MAKPFSFHRSGPAFGLPGRDPPSAETPERRVSRLIQTYAQHAIDGMGDDESPPSLLAAALEAVSDAEILMIGVAILARLEALSDPDYRIGGKHQDPTMKTITEYMGGAAAGLLGLA